MEYTDLSTMMASQAMIEYHGIRFTSQGVASTSHGKPVRFFKRKDVLDIRLKKGLRAKFPLLRAALGAALAYWGAKMLYLLALEQLVVGWSFSVYHFLSWKLAGLPLLLLGLWLFLSTFQTCNCLEVRTKWGRRKLFFQGELDLKEVQRFLDKAAEMGYPLTIRR